ncbi:MAG TPA: hypothetical protein VGE22_19750 [Solimonas sp.]
MSLLLRQVLMLLLACGLSLQGMAASLPCHHARTVLAQAQAADEHAHHAHHQGMAEADTASTPDSSGCLGGCDCPGHCGLSLALLPPLPVMGEDATPAPLRLARWTPPLQTAHGQSLLRPPITA